MSYQELYRGLNKTASYEEIATLATMLKQAALIKEEKSGTKIKGNILKKAGLPVSSPRAGKLGPRIYSRLKPTVLPKGTGASFGRDYSKGLKALGYGAGGATLGSAGNYLLNTRPLKAENKELRNQLGTGFWDRVWKAIQALFNGTSKNYVSAA